MLYSKTICNWIFLDQPDSRLLYSLIMICENHQINITFAIKKGKMRTGEKKTKKGNLAFGALTRPIDQA